MARTKKTVAPDATWTFLSNHAHVLLLIARDPEIRLRDVAEQVGITERAVQRIVADLEAGHYITRERSGRRNHYHVNDERPLRHPVEAHRTVRTLVALILDPSLT
jgi:DNA-binding MarR family transcriptional regulator